MSEDTSGWRGGVMVNSAKITVSKLSKLQKLILVELREKPITQEFLAHTVAGKHEVVKTERKLLDEREAEEHWNEIKEEHPALYAMATSGVPSISNNFSWGEGFGNAILSNQFKATFYRAIRRLIERRIVRRYHYRGRDEFGMRYEGTAVMIRPEALEILEDKGIFAIHSKSLRI